MTDFILCIAAGCLLLWVVILKREISLLQQNQTKLMGLLKRQLKDQTGDVEVTTIERGWGKKVELEGVDTSWVQKRNSSSPRQPKGG